MKKLLVRILKEHWPLFMALGVLYITAGMLLILSLSQNKGNLVYALDDPYIHMAIAKNFTRYGVWGINKYNFTSSSSSPLWTFLLALTYFLFGVNEISPLVLNFLFCTLLVCGAYFLLKKYAMRPSFTNLVLFSIIFFTPLPSLIFCGQEHIMHILLTLLLFYFSSRTLSEKKYSLKDYVSLLLLAPILSFTRYEGLFLIFVISFLFVLRKRFLHSLYLVGAGVLLISIYGIISILKGWYFLPNPVIIKGNIYGSSLIDVSKFLYNFITELLTAPHIFVLLLVALYFFISRFNKKKTLWNDSTIMPFIFILVTLLHLLFAKTGWFFRYEAYLVSLGIFVIAIVMQEYLEENRSGKPDRKLLPGYLAIPIIIFFVLPLAGRGLIALALTPRATTNIYEQQYQIGLFLKRFYQGECIATNDIGAINYLADIKCLDLWGLADSEVLRLKREKIYNTLQIYELARKRNVKIAIVYNHWFERYGGIPPQWIKAGEWKISFNVVCGGDTVSFYAVDPSEEDNLIRNLRAFSSSLPEDVFQSGEYTEESKKDNFLEITIIR